MKILALDSSGLVASVAIVCDDVLQAEYTINYKKTHSQTLLPMLEEVKNLIELDMSTVDAIAVACGPGSFTGLRIGSATAKGLGLALDKPLIGVPTLEGLAYQLHGTDKLVCPIMDARRNQVYTGIYEFVRRDDKNDSDNASLNKAGTYSLEIVEEQCAVDIHDIAGCLNALGREVCFLGDGVPVFREILAELLTVPYSFAPAHMNRQSAAALAALARVYYEQGRYESAAEHQPVYLRLSQAERERMEADASLQTEEAVKG